MVRLERDFAKHREMVLCSRCLTSSFREYSSESYPSPSTEGSVTVLCPSGTSHQASSTSDTGS